MTTHTLPPDPPSLESLIQGLASKGRVIVEANKRLAGQQANVVEARKAALERQLARLEWRPVAAVAMFEEIRCTHCGNEVSIFRSFGVEMQRQSDSVIRYTQTTELDLGLPFHKMVTHSAVPACELCIDEQARPAEGLHPSYTPTPERERIALEGA